MRYSTKKLTQLFSVHEVTAQPREAAPRSNLMLSEALLWGEKFGFMKKPAQPLVVCVFVTKGGVLKSTLTLNLARMAALHNIRTCVVGLDMQGDVSTSLGHELGLEQAANLDAALERLNAVNGLADLMLGHIALEELIVHTDLPTLDFIPETAELVAIEQQLSHRHRREHWLSDQVIAKLKTKYDLILLDCPPNWNQLITNALVSCDVLISPLECKINNFKNVQMFRFFIQDFQREMQLSFRHIFVPTRFSQQRRLSGEIRRWYQDNIPLCLENCIRENTAGEEAVAMHQSTPEYAASSSAAQEMKLLLKELWHQCLNAQTQAPQKDMSYGPQTLRS
jgi:chromosome partitioning protein